MKKIWIAVLVMILFVVADMLVRMFLSDSKDSSDVDISKQEAVQVYQDPSAGAGNHLEKKKDKPDNSEPEPTKRIKPQKLVLKSRSGFKNCREMKAFLFGKPIDKLSPKDVSRVLLFGDIKESSHHIIKVLDKYFTCKATTERLYSFCERASELLGEDADCDLTFRNLLPVMAKFIDKKDFQQFQASAISLPKTTREYVLKIFKAIDSGDPDACLRFGEGEADRERFVCKVVTGGIASDKSLDNGLREAFWGLTAIKKNDVNLINKIKGDKFVKRTFGGILGKKGQCEILLKELAAEVCK